MIRTARTALIFSVDRKHTVLTSHRSRQCLDTTMHDMDMSFFFLAHICSEGKEKNKGVLPGTISGRRERQLSALGTQSALSWHERPHHYREGCVS